MSLFLKKKQPPLTPKKSMLQLQDVQTIHPSALNVGS